ncbi:MAG: hypothetical protein VB118_02510 [Oscillospiraceae bacterium]|nr:hypothetical protein [Oscillospiraceae bacterium]
MKKAIRLFSVILACMMISALIAVSSYAAPTTDPKFIAWTDKDNGVIFYTDFEGYPVAADGMPTNIDTIVQDEKGMRVIENAGFTDDSLPYGFVKSKDSEFTDAKIFQSTYGWYRKFALGFDKTDANSVMGIRTAYIPVEAGTKIKTECVLWFVDNMTSAQGVMGFKVEYWDKDLKAVAATDTNYYEYTANSDTANAGNAYDGGAGFATTAPAGTAYITVNLYATKDTIANDIQYDCLLIKTDDSAAGRAAMAPTPAHETDADAVIAKAYADAHPTATEPAEDDTTNPTTGDTTVVFALVAALSLAGVVVAKRRAK